MENENNTQFTPGIDTFKKFKSHFIFARCFLFCLYEAISLHGLWWRSWCSTSRSKSWWGCPVLAGFSGSIPDYLAMNSTAHAVMQLDIELGKHIGVEDTGFGNVPDRGGLDDVPNDELLDGLVFGHAPGAVRAADRLHVAAALLGPAVVSPFFGHLGAKTRKRARPRAGHPYIVRDPYARAGEGKKTP